jgi:hypothetical protein
VAKLIGPGDALRRPLLPELFEPVLRNLGNGLLVLRGFEREGEAAAVLSHGENLLGISVFSLSKDLQPAYPRRNCSHG